MSDRRKWWRRAEDDGADLPEGPQPVDSPEALEELEGASGVTSDGGAYDEENEEEDPYLDAAYLLHSCPNTVAGLAVVIGHLIDAGSITTDDLVVLGFEEDAGANLVESFRGNVNLDYLHEDLQLAAALRGYRREISSIAEGRGLAPGSSEHERLRRNITSFALTNDIEDIGIAYRLMRLECPDQLPGREP